MNSIITRQARAIEGGLHPHSIGEDYPYAVVGIGNGDKTEYQVEDLQRGKVLHKYTLDVPQRWDNASDAFRAIESFRIEPSCAEQCLWGDAR